MEKFTDEELSRILSAAAVPGGLVKFGTRRRTGIPCCVVQAAKASDTGYGHGCADVIDWFDWLGTSDLASDPDAMLRALEEKGWA